MSAFTSIQQGKKICSKCKESKNLQYFNKFKRSKDGYSYSCKCCNKEIAHRGDAKYRAKQGYSEILSRSYFKNKTTRLKANIDRAKQRRKTDVVFRIVSNCRSRIHKVIKNNKKTDRSLILIGCSGNQLKLHLEQQFTEGMSWSNYGKDGWEIDHIKPCSLFNMVDPEEQRKCFHYTNLQPLWALDNKIKSNKYVETNY